MVILASCDLRLPGPRPHVAHLVYIREQLCDEVHLTNNPRMEISSRKCIANILS